VNGESELAAHAAFTLAFSLFTGEA
jgi:hypothetical protein